MSRFHDEFFKQKGPKHDQLVMKCVSPEGQSRIVHKKFIEDAIAYCTTPKSPFKPEDLCVLYETEVICSSHGYKSQFIVGYADIIFWIYDHPQKSVGLDSPLCAIIVEVKPELTDVGAVLRQIKTYQSLVNYGRYCRKVIATYSSVPDDVLNYLKHEGVRVVVFQEDA